MYMYNVHMFNKIDNVRINVALRRVRGTIVAVEKQLACIYSLWYSACNAHAP